MHDLVECTDTDKDETHAYLTVRASDGGCVCKEVAVIRIRICRAFSKGRVAGHGSSSSHPGEMRAALRPLDIPKVKSERKCGWGSKFE
jgi:hypothetical protein